MAAARSISCGFSGTTGLYASTLFSMDREGTFQLVSALVALQAPSGVEDAIDAYLEERLGQYGLRADGGGNRIVRIAGRGAAPATAIAAHKDEIARS